MKSERILILPCGNYEATRQYTILDLVIYQNKSYMCIKDSKGNFPTNTEFFKEFISFPAIQDHEDRLRVIEQMLDIV